MTPSLRLLIVATTTTCMLSACGKPPADDHDDHDHAGETAGSAGEATGQTGGEDQHEEDGHEDEEQVVELTPEELEEFGIGLAIAASAPIEVVTNLPGEVVMNPDGVAHVVSRASGIVIEVYKTIGDTVTTGEPLAVLESPALAQAKADYLSRSREYELARTDLARAETVYENTRELLAFLGDNPNLDALRAFSDLDLGENRRVLVSTYAQLVASEAVFARESLLFEKKVGSEAEYLEAESEFKQAQAAFLSVRDDLAFTNARTLDQRRREAKVAEVALLAAERKLHALGLSESVVASVAEQSDEELARYVIASPHDGVIIERHIVRGEQMSQGDDIYTIADLSTVWVQLTVYQKDLPVLRAGQPAEISAHHGIAQAQGTIDYISPVISEATRTTTARVVLANASGDWRPGLFVTGQIITGSFTPTLTVPRSAIQTIEDEMIIFVQTDHGFEPHHVELGRGNDTHVEVLEGLKPGDTYVADGAFALKAELNKASFAGGGHAH